MTSPRLRIRARLIRLFVYAVLGGVLSARAAGFDLDALMTLLSDHPHGRVSFVETRHLALLDRPIAARGDLVFIPPDRLERHTQAPRQESAILDGDTLTLIREGRRRELSLSQHPGIALLIGSLRAVLSGDRARLERDFVLSHAGTPDAWILDLLPRAPEAVPSLRRIHLVGSRGQVERVEMIETDGDRSVIEIGDALP
ncbi:outer membrane lipoprotein carrier protein LolA [Thiorhodococcus mannitoliphagus]|uniref:Outer membrane lipoprotein carrier protein LolA n=1 Tax=Thiorhodococcus mannitoliphagus TaxID=329406 RepID=A0A6P1DT63_9GAMM|nr:LolA-related protein [Thiorhodococcus mannitoliphagus]NEX20393.1 outer membrane lipoprotein carrier protein LolA [Thiorhodococcus mannitoliphagus]